MKLISDKGQKVAVAIQFGALVTFVIWLGWVIYTYGWRLHR